MPAPEPRKPPQSPQDEPAKPHGTNPPPAPARPQEPAQEPKKVDAPPEPVKGEDGKPMIAPVAVATSAIPHESDEDREADEPRPDRTVPGGRYQVGDKIVNANGEVLEDAPAPKSRKK